MTDPTPRTSLATAVLPKTPLGLMLLHTFGVGVVTGALSYAAGALALGVDKPHFWHSLIVGCAAAGASRGLGALVAKLQLAETP